MSSKILYSILLILFISLIIISCDDTLINNDIDSVIIPDNNVSYNEYIQPLFNYKCTNSGCHDGQSSAAGLNLTTWANATADPSIVFPYSPESSKLVWAIEGLSGASSMPPVGAPVTPMTENQINGIKVWISEGAQNN
jgi:hypothetical protein